MFAILCLRLLSTHIKNKLERSPFAHAKVRRCNFVELRRVEENPCQWYPASVEVLRCVTVGNDIHLQGREVKIEG